MHAAAHLWGHARLRLLGVPETDGMPLPRRLPRAVAEGCARCGRSVSDNVRDACLAQPERFAGFVYCDEHQRTAARDG